MEIISGAAAKTMIVPPSTGCAGIPRGAFNCSPFVIGFALAGVTIGTGGSLTVPSWFDLSRRACATTVSYEVGRFRDITAVPSEDLLSTQEKLAAIQHYFSLNVKELADVLRVSRPTVYSWLRTEQETQPGNLIRIAELYKLTQLWQTISIKPIGNWIRTPVIDGRSLVQLFSDEHINKEGVSAAFQMVDALSKKAQRAKKQIIGDQNLERSAESERELLSQEFGI